MKSNDGQYLKILFLCLDIIAALLAGFFALIIRFGSIYSIEHLDSYILFGQYLICFRLVLSAFQTYNNKSLRYGHFEEFIHIIKENIILMIALIAVMFAIKDSYISRYVFFFFVIINTMLQFLLHSTIRYLYRKGIIKLGEASKLLIITNNENIDFMQNQLKKSRFKCDVVGTLVWDDNTDSIIEESRKMALDEVLIFLPGIGRKTIQKIIMQMESMGVICHYCLDDMDFGTRNIVYEEMSGFAVATYSGTNQISALELFCKRAMDITGAVVGLILTGIVTLFIAPAIMLDSPGPIVFSQVRIGRNGRRFKIYKFRSMYIDAEERKKELEQKNEMSGLMFKMENDPRVTRVGNFIRRTSIDELPQFWNILKGDMSLVGTRPPTEDEFMQYTTYHRRRLCMIPGLTGMWQVSGRSEIKDFDEIVKLDLQYIDNWSLGLDIKILVKTVAVVLFRKGAK